MDKLVLTLPTLYGDHHTTAVRDILENLDGVSDVYASSSFHQVSLAYDPKVVKKEAIETACVASAICVTRMGAMDSIPTMDEVITMRTTLREGPAGSQ